MLSLLILECKQKKFFESILNLHTSLYFLLIWNWNHKYFHTLCNSSKKHTQFKTRVHKPYPISDQNGRNWYPISDQNGAKTLPDGVAHTYIAYIREYPPRGQQGCHYLQISHPNAPLITFTIFNYIHYIQEWLMKKVAPWNYKRVSLSTDFLDKGH